MCAWVAVGIAGVSAGAKIISGISQKHQANQIEKNNIRPVQSVDPAYQQNVNQATQMAQEGMPSQQYNNSLNNIGRNQSGGLMALGRSANPSAGIASIVRAGNDATNSLDAQSAGMRNQNILNLMRQRNILSQQRQNAFDYNNKDKYSENLAKSQAYLGAGNQNINSGLNEVGSVGATMLSGKMKGSAGSGFNLNNPSTYPVYNPALDPNRNN
ncbi:MAG: hypothetical protein JWQ09_5872 [Segetibacter sp.]|nr:hypothetical protein [Segetibacter sp.]